MSKGVLGDNPLRPADLQNGGKTPEADNAMLPWLSKDSVKGAAIQEIAIDLIEPNPNQPRSRFDQTSLEEFAQSIKDRGVLQPVTVRPVDGGRYILIMGERRWRASKLAGLSSIPALIRVTGDLLELALIENVQREDLGPIDTAEALQALKIKHGYTDEALAKVVGKSRVWVTSSLAIAKLPEEALKKAKEIGFKGREVLIEIAREKDPETAKNMLGDALAGKAKVRNTREKRQGHGGQKTRNFKFRYAPKSGDYVLSVVFRRSRINKEEIKTALERATASLGLGEV